MATVSDSPMLFEKIDGLPPSVTENGVTTYAKNRLYFSKDATDKITIYCTSEDGSALFQAGGGLSSQDLANLAQTITDGLADYVQAPDNKGVLISGTDLNTLNDTGFFIGQTLSNAPAVVGTGWCTVESIVISDTRRAQKLTSLSSLYTVSEYWRTMIDGVWTAWNKIKTDDGDGKKSVSSYQSGYYLVGTLPSFTSGMNMVCGVSLEGQIGKGTYGSYLRSFKIDIESGDDFKIRYKEGPNASDLKVSGTLKADIIVTKSSSYSGSPYQVWMYANGGVCEMLIKNVRSSGPTLDFIDTQNISAPMLSDTVIWRMSDLLPSSSNNGINFGFNTDLTLSPWNPTIGAINLGTNTSIYDDASGRAGLSFNTYKDSNLNFLRKYMGPSAQLEYLAGDVYFESDASAMSAGTANVWTTIGGAYSGTSKAPYQVGYWGALRYANLQGLLGTYYTNAKNHFTPYATGTAYTTQNGKSVPTLGWGAVAIGDATSNRLVLGQFAGKAVLGALNSELGPFAKLTFMSTDIEVLNDVGATTMTVSNGGDVTAAGSLISTGPLKPGQYTLTTLPSAAAYSGYHIDVVDATGGPKTCRSNGTNWIILNTTTTVS